MITTKIAGASFLALALLMPCGIGADEVSAPDTRPLAAFLSDQKSVRSLRADFIQERELPSLTNPLKNSGKMVLKHPDRFRWEIGSPSQTVILRRPDEMFYIDVEQKEAKRLDPDGKRASQFLLFLTQMPDELVEFEKQFEVRSTVVQKGIYKVTLAPKNRRMRSHVPWLILHIDTTTNQLSGFELFTKDKSVIRTFFGNVVINPEIDDTEFAFDLTGYAVKK